MKNIWVNGCFDILHVGHIELFKYAKSLGDKLYVGVDTDERVKELKGSDRPFNTLSDRKQMLSAIKYIDSVTHFSNEVELINTLKKLNIDILVVGSDYRDKKVIGSEVVKKVVFFDKLDGYSTTNILNNK